MFSPLHFHLWLAVVNPKWTSLGLCFSSISCDKLFNKCPEEGMYSLLLNGLLPDANKTVSICLIRRDCNDFLVMQLPLHWAEHGCLHVVELFSCQQPKMLDILALNATKCKDCMRSVGFKNYIEWTIILIGYKEKFSYYFKYIFKNYPW